MPEVFEGRLDVECAALRERAARLPREADWLRVTGPDRLRFTNGLVTSDLRRLEDGSGAYGFFTDSKGRVLADAAFLVIRSPLRKLWTLANRAEHLDRLGEHPAANQTLSKAAGIARDLEAPFARAQAFTKLADAIRLIGPSTLRLPQPTDDPAAEVD